MIETDFESLIRDAFKRPTVKFPRYRTVPATAAATDGTAEAGEIGRYCGGVGRTRGLGWDEDPRISDDFER